MRLSIGGSCFILLVFALAVSGCGRGGVTVELTNARPETVEGLELHVTGAHRQLDPLAPGETTSVRLRPIGESSIYLIDRATSDTLGVCCYLEPGIGGRVQFRVEVDTVVIGSHDSGRVGILAP